MEAKKIQKILIANRSEIACRVISACKILGIKTVAVYSEVDAKARHVRLADEAVCIGAGPAAESYLDIKKLIKVAKETGATAIHPGYGFLSERSAFAKAVLDAGLIWIGPKPEVIDLMGSKIAAKKMAEKAKVPTLPWGLLSANSADSLDLSELKKAAAKIGFPLLLKASAGGGGRGMRVVNAESELEESAKSAMREAAAAFGSGEIFLESYKDKARHVEVQIMGDSHGQVFTFGERDCTAQRRHQKVLEEAPAPKLSQKTKEALWSAARNLAKEVGYENAGTCEFLVADDEKFFFLEMNTRLQVEHPVTELVWGIDLVELQIKVAQGEKLPSELSSIQPRGHAIEARIYAENPAKGFMPSPGKIKTLTYPSGPRIRVDFGYEVGDEVPIYYDAMIAKVISWGMNREQAIDGLIGAISEMQLSGVAWNGLFLNDILGHKDFKDFSIYTKWIETKLKDWKPSGNPPVSKSAAKVEVTATAATSVISPWFFYGTGDGKIGNASSDSENAYSSDHTYPQDLSGPLVAEHPGKVLKLKTKAGDKVASGQVLVVCESMKMEFNYSAPADAKVKAVHVKEGQVIPAGTMLIEWED